MNKYPLIICLLALILMIGCQDNSQENRWMADEDIAMSSDALLTDESLLGDMPVYIDSEEDKSVSFVRSFENAPPMIPHKISGLVPITLETNKCLQCHMPDKSDQMGSTPLPGSHFINYRPAMVEKDGLIQSDAEANEVIMVDLKGKLSGAMFNCTMCHAPQAIVSIDIANLFTPQFRRGNGDSRSNLADVMDEGVR